MGYLIYGSKKDTPITAVTVSISCKNCNRIAMSSTVIVALAPLVFPVVVVGMMVGSRKR